MTEEEKRVLAERARLILENLGWKMTKLTFEPDKIVMVVEKPIEEKTK